MNYLILILSWSLYLVLHSLFAADPVKEFFYATISIKTRLYRLVYAALSTLGLIALILLMAMLESTSLYVPGPGVKLVALMIATWGVLIISMAFRHLSGLAFMGLKKESTNQLVTTGIHAKIRHPIYSGTILILLGMIIYSPTDIALVSIVTIFVYLPIGIFLEEKKLIREFGDAYVAYRTKVPALIPRLI